MSTFLDRLKDEATELEEKVMKLGDFIENNPAFYEVDETQQFLLSTQYDVMIAYLHILGKRIHILTK
jgi:hypothetical protein